MPEVIRDDFLWTHKILPQARTYFVRSEMTTLVLAAAKSLPQVVTDFAILDCPAGFVVYEEPAEFYGALEFDDRDPVHATTDGFVWSVHGEELVVVHLSDFDKNRPQLMPNYTFRLDRGQPPPEEGDQEARIEGLPVIARFWATQILMRQTLACIETTGPDRGERRRQQRMGRKPQKVRVVKLRRITHLHKGAPGMSPVEWSHRWIVSGHWTKQPHGPGKSLRRLQWIHPYIKGPEDKPLAVKETVSGLVRLWNTHHFIPILAFLLWTATASRMSTSSVPPSSG